MADGSCGLSWLEPALLNFLLYTWLWRCWLQVCKDHHWKQVLNKIVNY
jgi:hypothetical protein